MFENLKLKLAHYTTRKKYLKKNLEPIVFNKIISNALEFLILMPEDDKEFYHSVELLQYLNIHRKNVTIFAAEHKFNLIPEKEKYKFISYTQTQKNKFNLPDPILVNKLKDKSFDVVIDLNRNENIFFSAVTNIVNSNLRMSYIKERSEGYYNFQFAETGNDPEVSLRNLINFLQMF